MLKASSLLQPGWQGPGPPDWPTAELPSSLPKEPNEDPLVFKTLRSRCEPNYLGETSHQETAWPIICLTPENTPEHSHCVPAMLPQSRPWTW